MPHRHAGERAGPAGRGPGPWARARRFIGSGPLHTVWISPSLHGRAGHARPADLQRLPCPSASASTATDLMPPIRRRGITRPAFSPAIRRQHTAGRARAPIATNRPVLRRLPRERRPGPARTAADAGYHDAKQFFLLNHGQAARQSLESCVSVPFRAGLPNLPLGHWRAAVQPPRARLRSGDAATEESLDVHRLPRDVDSGALRPFRLLRAAERHSWYDEQGEMMAVPTSDLDF